MCCAFNKKYMQKPPEIVSSGTLLMDPPGFIRPDVQNFTSTEITPEVLRLIAKVLEVDYLGRAVYPGTFPVRGSLYGEKS